MNNLSRIFIFLLVNALGFLSVMICFYIGIQGGYINSTNVGNDPIAFKNYFFAGTLMTWSVCALFSFAYFFLHGKVRWLFLWIPLVVPMVYGLYIILSRF